MNLAGASAIVTGGGWNIGRAVAIALARAGARVTLAARDRARLEETRQLIAGAGGEALVVPTDVTDAAACDRLVAAALERFGTVDALVNLAGGFGAGAPLDRVEPAAWIDVVSRNLIGTFLATRAALPALSGRPEAHVITCAGAGAFFPEIGSHMTAYASAKAAICRFTDQLAAELLDTAIRVNCIEPGMVWDPPTLERIAAEEQCTGHPHPDRGRNRPPEAAAELVLFLLGAGAAGLNGRLVSVNDSWWRDPAEVARVAAGDACRLRRSLP
ncbi:MAG: SDR family oxidoreductase [Planctomycetes bacterium]|nr:SDR family oxidoreductase [Planctomycetota bacterium]